MSDDYADGSLKTDKNKGITSIVYNYLGLVEKVVVSEGQNLGTINYIYDGSGRKWSKVVYDQIKVVTTKTDYDQEIQFENNKLSFILHEEGRVISEDQTVKLAYEYHYKDHLGNLRVAFRQRSQAQKHSSLTLEPVLAASEEASFDNVDQSRVAGVAHSGNYSARVEGIGPAKQVQLEVGEKLQVNVFGHVEAEGKHKISFLPLPVLGDVPAGGENSKRKLAIKGGVLVPLNWGSKNTNQPAAYLEIVASDSSGKVVHSERKSLSNAASESWEELQIDYQAKGAETVVIQLVNPSDIVAVHFDDLTISQEPPLIVQENHYDPWGLNLVGIEQNGSPEHQYQYNDKEKQGELGLAWYDYGARMYDPQIGRWHVVDPVSDWAEDLTPYRYGLNNPVNYIDLLGLWEDKGDRYSTSDQGDISRFLTYLQAEKSHGNTTSSASMSGFIQEEMGGKNGSLSDGTKLLSTIEVTGRRTESGTSWTANQQSVNRVWNQVQSDLDGNTDSDLDFSYRHLVGPGMGLLSADIHKTFLKRFMRSFVMNGASKSTSIFSTVMARALPPNYTILGKNIGRFAKQRFTHTTILNGMVRRHGTREVGRFIGRWGTKIMGRLSGPLMMADIFYTSYTNFQAASPEEQTYLINPWSYSTSQINNSK